MKRISEYLKKSREAMGTRTAKIGGYSFVITVFVLAILILVNVAVSALPDTWTQFDISAQRLYSVTSSTKAVVQNLGKDVTVYWVTQSGEESNTIERLLNVYDALSDRLTVVKKNPDVYPTFAAQYTDETVSNNSLIVECGDRYRYIPYEDLYDADTSSYYTTGSVAYSFDGEGQITTAISYVVSDDLPVIYTLTGHGEAELSDTFSSALESQNVETESFSLLNVDEIPEDAAAILINAPTSDISEEEAGMLSDYLDNGGKIMVLSGPQDEVTLTNLQSLLTKYGITAEEGIVIEGSRSNYAFGYPYVLLPELGDSEITDELSENNSYVIIPIAGGLTVGTAPDGVTVTSLLTTTDESFSKVAGYALTTYEKEDGDIDGAFAVAISAQDSTGGELIWIASDNVMDATYNSYSSGANSDFVMNGISELIGNTEAISIRSKSLSYSYLTISSEQASFIKVIMIAVIPLIFIFAGVDDVIYRRRHA